MAKVYGSMYERLVANSEKPDDQNECGCWLWTIQVWQRLSHGWPVIGRPGPGLNYRSSNARAICC